MCIRVLLSHLPFSFCIYLFRHTAVFVLHILPHLVLDGEDDDVDDDYA